MKVMGKLTKSMRSYEGQKALWGFLFVSPWLIGFLLFFLAPLITSFRYSFSKVEASSSGIQTTFVGLSNYVEALLVNPNFNRQLLESIMDIVIDVPLILIFSLFVAVILNQQFLGRSL